MYWRFRKIYIASMALNEGLKVKDEGHKLVALSSKNQVYDIASKAKIDNPGFKKYKTQKKGTPYVMMLNDPYDFDEIVSSNFFERNIFRYKTLKKAAELINEGKLFNINTSEIKGKSKIKK